jgi:hypothetical protein
MVARIVVRMAASQDVRAVVQVGVKIRVLPLAMEVAPIHVLQRVRVSAMVVAQILVCPLVNHLAVLLAKS